MPWYLQYPDDGDARTLRGTHLALFAASKDVYRVDDEDHLGGRLVIVFRDEESRTNDPALIAIHSTYGYAFFGPLNSPVLEPGLFGNLNGDVLPEVRNQIIAQYMASTEGRSRLASSMVAPLRERRDYTSLGRRTFIVEQLPQGALPTYDRDPDGGVWDAILGARSVISGAGPVDPVGLEDAVEVHVPVTVSNFIEPHRITAPMFEMGSSTTVHISDVLDRRYSMRDRHNSVGYDANGSPVHADLTPEWIRPGQWIYYKATDTYACITEVDGIVVGSVWRSDTTCRLTMTTVALYWVPCERPSDPRPAWSRLMEDALF